MYMYNAITVGLLLLSISSLGQGEVDQTNIIYIQSPPNLKSNKEILISFRDFRRAIQIGVLVRMQLLFLYLEDELNGYHLGLV